MKKKILIVSCVFPPEPVVSASISSDLAEKLSNENDVHVICPQPSRPFGFSFDYSIYRKKVFYKIKRLISFVYAQNNPIGRLIESTSFGLSCFVYILLNKKKFDVVYINTWPIFAQLLTCLVCKLRGYKYLIHIQDIYPESYINKKNKKYVLSRHIMMLIDIWNLRNAYKVICISDKMKEYLHQSRGLKPDSLTTVYNWGNNEIKKINAKEKKEENFIFLYLGNIGISSGIHRFIKIFGAQSEKKIEFHICGNGAEKENLKILSKNFSNIKFVSVPDGEVMKNLSKSDVLFLPMLKGAATYSVPSKLISYFNASKPVLAAVNEESEIARLIIESKSGWVFDDDDESGFELLINKVSEINKQELTRIGLNGYNYGRKIFSRESNLNSLAEII